MIIEEEEEEETLACVARYIEEDSSHTVDKEQF